ncbi:MAG: UvrD-helicase domain-containing protein [Lachnospiraceae bacterium]|nr:UvrD-helicase domain-containing protein [Lachnospiraceae bacterium]
MKVKWTREQEQAIHLRDRNILVNAAAGSGKTAVLVERIISRVIDPVQPVNIDKLLVVTFTKAAAGEMKERIARALEEKLMGDPENEHLQRQGILLHHAQISTIHSFCTYVIQNYFHRIDLDPGYRIADEGELDLLKGNVLSDLIEKEYSKGDRDFLEFTEAFAPGKSDKKLDELIFRVYQFAVSDPWPERWLAHCQKACGINTEEEFEKSALVRAALEEVKRLLFSCREMALQNMALVERPGGPSVYFPQLTSDLQLIERLMRCVSYGKLYEEFQNLSFMPLARKKNSSNEELRLREKVKKSREELKKLLEGIQKQYFTENPEAVLKEYALCKPFMEVLCRLVVQFMREFAKRKRWKNLVDFSDLEHFALDILLTRTDQGWVRTDVARELSEQFVEIMIDEYQDSNYIQEYLLEAVSGREKGNFNRFMVGDMKQAIYGFRMARPELFLEKYQTYTHGTFCHPDHAGQWNSSCCSTKDTFVDSSNQRIDLNQNFRSRPQILNMVNYFFRKLMKPELGEFPYDEAASLHRGADFPEGEESSMLTTELLLIDRKSPAFDNDRSRTAMIEVEALTIAKKIRSLMGSMQVTDCVTGFYRPLQYRDCVILLRSVSGWAEIFVRVLQNEGIPAYSTSKSGYFSAVEVVTVLNYLRICDNQRQEIPYAAVLHSPIVGCSDRELAQIRCHSPELPIYEASAAYEAGGKESILREKLRAFSRQLRDIQSIASYTPVHRIIQKIFSMTGYRSYAAAMPGGEQRKANLDMLVEKAVEFESTSYHGLFHFVRYIEKLEKYQVDFGAVNLYGETMDTVRIMTIHKSKGLEFPVVFVSGMGGKFNQMDLNSQVVLHAGLGIGMDAVDVRKRFRKSTLVKQTIRQAMKRDFLGEEMRVLYVAMTRAREKMILTGIVDNLEKSVKTCAIQRNLWKDSLSYAILSKAASYMDWLLTVLSRSSNFYPLYQLINGNKEAAKLEEEAYVKLEVMTPSQMTKAKLESKVQQELIRANLSRKDDKQVHEPEVREFLEKQKAYRYPYEYLVGIPEKMTVSELKKASADEQGLLLYAIPDIIPYIPKFMKQVREEVNSSTRGMIYHRVLECLDYV